MFKIGTFKRLALALGAAMMLDAPGAHAQTYPSKPIRLIVPYPAGGATDFFARTVFAKVSDVIGQQVVVENRPGAGTAIGAELVARSAPDGYTLLVGDTATYALNTSLYRKLPYDPAKDFAPVSLTGRFALFLVVNPSTMSATNVGEFLAAARQSPGKINYAAPGPGSPLHVAMELFKQQTNVVMTAIPYKGGGDAVKDLLGGQISTMFLDAATAAPLVKSGKLRALAVAADKRIASFPDVPTVSEAGVSGFEAWAWQGFAAPAGTPPAVIDKLNASFARALDDPGVKQRLFDAGVDPIPSTPQRFAEYMASETRKWARVIKQSNISLD